jgi:predicted PurR-regulated permease PerM
MSLSFQKIFYAIAVIFSCFAILILAKPILIPLAFALLFSFILFPLVKRFVKWGANNTLATFLAMFLVFLIIGGIFFLFSRQIIQLSQNFSNLQDKIVNAIADIRLYINENVNLSQNLNKEELINNTKGWLFESSGSIIKSTFNNTASFITGLTLTAIFTFLILLYRNGLVKGFSMFSSAENRDAILNMFKSIQQVGQKYLGGMLLVILIIGIVNSVGLWLIGVDNPFLFGFLGALLSIIPYIGTVSGALIPMLYAFATYDSLWIVLYIAILFWSVQLLTDNFLSPKIIGNQIKINPFAAILSLIIGASVWGIAGMVLFLPFTAMFKVVCEQFNELKPVGLLIGEKNYTQEEDTSTFKVKIKNIIQTLLNKKTK